MNKIQIRGLEHVLFSYFMVQSSSSEATQKVDHILLNPVLHYCNQKSPPVVPIL